MARWKVYKTEDGDWCVMESGPDGRHRMHYWFQTWDEALGWTLDNLHHAVMAHIIVASEVPVATDMLEAALAQQENDAVRRRELRTIRPPSWCRLCGSSGIVSVYKGPDEWDVLECPADHSEPGITVHFKWKREPRWFEL